MGDLNYFITYLHSALKVALKYSEFLMCQVLCLTVLSARGIYGEEEEGDDRPFH